MNAVVITCYRLPLSRLPDFIRWNTMDLGSNNVNLIVV